jgi:hypothetical protein
MTTAAAPAQRRKPTDGYFTVPNSFAENQNLLTPAEQKLALIVLRRQGGMDRESAVLVPDSYWEAWTGLKPRIKDSAEKGLRKKGLMIDGRGRKAMYRFDRPSWESYVRHAPRSKPRTEGRAVEPMRGAQVHENCRANGCAVLRGEVGEDGLTLNPATENAQPVAQSQVVSIDSIKPSDPAQAVSSRINPVKIPPSCPMRSKQSSPAFASQVAQPVAQTAIETGLWARTLHALQSAFPTCGISFLVCLLAVVRALFADVTDAELARAIVFAFGRAAGKQKTEGLFLSTVPDAVAYLREHRPPGGQPTRLERWTGEAGKLLASCIEHFTTRGWAAHVAECQALLKRLEIVAPEFSVSPADDRREFYERLWGLRERVYKSAAAALTAEQRAAVDHQALKEPESFQDLIRLEQTFTILAIPLVEVPYA